MSVSHSVVPDSLRPHGLQPTRLLCSGDFPGKDTGVGCHSLLQGIFPTQGSNPGIFCTAGRFFTDWATREACTYSKECYNFRKSWQMVHGILDYKCFRKITSYLPLSFSTFFLSFHPQAITFQFLSPCSCLITKSCPTLLWPHGL